ncbi:MAG TPA: HAD hydrolase family protein [Oligoflexia bacterium]|nr:HAD hydrolase family protein [Oligoflexia bacterium]
MKSTKPRKFKNPFKQLPSSVQKRLKKIKLLALDIDGVMTDGRVFWVEGTGWTRQFSVKDGYGIKLIMKAGIDVAIISGGDSKSVRERANWLGIKHVYLGDENKIIAFDKIKKDTGLSSDQIAFVGDDLFDIPVLERVGFSATVPHAVPEVCAIVDYITRDIGGYGAVREICDLIRHAVESR